LTLKNIYHHRTCITHVLLIRNWIQESKSTVQKIGNTFCVNIVEDIEVRDKVSIVVGIAETIDETQIVEVFRKLQKINRYGMPKSSKIRDMNLMSSLYHYAAAIRI
jgi:hypothetical protein